VGDDRRLARALVFIASSVWMTGDALEARKLARSTLVIAEALADRTLTFMANYTLALVAFLLGDYKEAEVLSGKVLHAPEGGPPRVPGFPTATVHGFMAWARGDQGRFEDGSAQGLDGLRVAEASGRPFSVTWACWGLANLYGIQGNHAEALRLLDRAIAVSRAPDLGMWATFLGWARGHLYARSGRVAEGTALLRDALADHKARRLGVWESLITTHLAEAYLSAGRLDAPTESAVEALTLARARKEHGHEAYALRPLAEIAALCDPSVETAERHYREAMTLAAERSMRPLVAHCHLGLGKLYRRTDKREQAQEHFTTATTMYREMDMRFWLEQAEVELGDRAT
jgi:tetratricopeptide (TPR) repeat protein